MKVLSIALVSLLVVAFGLSQVISKPDKSDSSSALRASRPTESGRSDSTGLFTSSDGLTETYFRKGLAHGPFRSYSKKTGKLDCFGHFANDVKSGDWYYFHENDLLMMSEHGVRLNDTAMAMNGDGTRVRPLMRSFFRRYWPNGLVRAEGTCLYYESVEIDFWRYGPWSYYDTLGLPEKTANYYPGQFVND